MGTHWFILEEANFVIIRVFQRKVQKAEHTPSMAKVKRFSTTAFFSFCVNDIILKIKTQQGHETGTHYHRKLLRTEKAQKS